MKSNIRTVTLSRTVIVDPNVRRGASFSGVDVKTVEEKLRGTFSLAMAAKFPLHRWFAEPNGPGAGYYYVRPDDIPSP